MTAKRTVRGRTTRPFPSGSRYNYGELTDILTEHEAGVREGAFEQAAETVPDVTVAVRVAVELGTNVGTIVSRIESRWPTG
jgi:hypothetical protein